MPPTIHIRLGEPWASPCNASAMSGGTCVISVQLSNLTLGDEGADGSGLTAAQQDGDGAMRFIIAVLLVYSLMGTAGMLILRIRQSATKTNSSKNIAGKEAHHYLKYRDKIDADCHRARLVKETNKVLNHIQSLERQRSLIESLNLSNDEDREGPRSPMIPSTPHQGPTKGNILKQSHTAQRTHSLPPVAEISQPSPLPARPSYLRQPSLVFPYEYTDGYSELDPQLPWIFPSPSTLNHSLPTIPLPPDYVLKPPNFLATPACTTSSSRTPSNTTTSTSMVTPTVTTMAIVEGVDLRHSTDLQPTHCKNIEQ